MEFQWSYFKILRDNAMKGLHSVCQQIWKTWEWLQDWKRSIHAVKPTLGADCGSDHELLINKFRLKLKKVGKTTRPFRYDLNQIPYDYMVEVTIIQGIRSDRQSA